MPPVVRDRPPTPTRRRGRLSPLALRALGPVMGAMLVFALIVPGATSAASTWSKNLFVAKAFLYQDPYSNACTAAAPSNGQMNLNTGTTLRPLIPPLALMLSMYALYACGWFT